MSELIKLELGQMVDVSLESMMGSTGYGWELADLSGFVNLCGITTTPATGYAEVHQNFHFRGIKVGKGSAVFVLARPWTTEEPVQKKVYNFEVTEKVTKKDDEFKLKGFVAKPKDISPSQAGVTATKAAAESCSFDPRLAYGIFPDWLSDRRFLYRRLPEDLEIAINGFDPKVAYGFLPDSILRRQALQQAKTVNFDQGRYYYGVFPPYNGRDLAIPYGVCAPEVGDPRLYYGVRPPETLDPRLYYGVRPPMMRYNYPSAGTDCCQ